MYVYCCEQKIAEQLIVLVGQLKCFDTVGWVIWPVQTGPWYGL